VRALHRSAPLLLLLVTSCAGPRPRYAPVAPVRVETSSDGTRRQGYDFDNDGTIDLWETLPPQGRVTALMFAQAADGEQTVTFPPTGEVRHLLIILDSVPYELVRDLWRQGRFRMFYEPRPVISPFPVMTDPCLGEFFGVSPVPGVEAAFVRNGRPTVPLWSYITERNMPWRRCVDYRLLPVLHGSAYLDPDPWYEHELRRIEERFISEPQKRLFVGYVVSTSALGSARGRNGHQSALIRLDRLCRWIVYHMRGCVQITLMSDHGHNLIRSRRLPLADELRRAGWHVTDRLAGPDDVIVPQWGQVGCAALYTRGPAHLARDVLGFDGVELVAYRDGERVVVLNRSGEAVIERRGHAYRYTPRFGDPLKLRPIWKTLAQAADADGFVPDRVLFEATADHVYPDAVHRLWRAFDGLIQNPPDVLVSLEEGWLVGSGSLRLFMQMASVHGSLRAPGSVGFVMTTAGPLPEVLRMEDLAEVLRRAGVPLPAASRRQGRQAAGAASQPTP